MLHSAAPPSAVPAAPSSCPRCKQPLVDPSGLGWCKACGYCRSVAESEVKTEAAVPSAKPNTVTATGAALGQTPTWVWVTFAGILLITGLTFAGGKFLTLSPLERALLTTVQIAIGAAMMFSGQFIGLIRVAPEESALGFWDAVFPFRLYGIMLKRLPSTRHTIYLGTWGLAAVVSVAVLIGGLGHWMTYLPHNQKNQLKNKK